MGHQHPKLTAVMGVMPQSLKDKVLLGFCGLLGYHDFLGYLGSSYLSMKNVMSAWEGTQASLLGMIGPTTSPNPDQNILDTNS